MSVTEFQRHQIFQSYEEAMGAEKAAAMMDLLPPVGWGEIATKSDLVLLEGRLRGEIAEVRGDMKLGHADLLHRMVVANVVSNATLVGLVFAAVKLGG